MIGDDDAPTPATTESESDCTCLISLRAAESFFRACGIDPVQWLRRAGVHDVWPDVGLGCYAYFADGGRGELCAARWEGDDPWKYAKWPAAPARPTQLLVGRATRGCWEALSRPMPGDRRACVVCCPLERREDVCRFNPDVRWLRRLLRRQMSPLPSTFSEAVHKYPVAETLCRSDVVL
eukprot:TRINITY_DN2759_c0_g1_i1.p2 TRINITY_DN2759_c0_g1~~TRINITY_DN2759_c0_g1_i1.p2  ORF type:complete len:179 (+),score=21.63 TRINITY_DN2759_c0_g1_i1:32-568(+)